MEQSNTDFGAIADLSASKEFPKKSGTAASQDATVLTASDLTGVSALPEVVVFYHKHLRGIQWRTNSGWLYVGDYWNDKISSITVVRGVWRFYQHSDFKGDYWDLGVGVYPWVEDEGIPNGIISSFQPISC